MNELTVLILASTVALTILVNIAIFFAKQVYFSIKIWSLINKTNKSFSQKEKDREEMLARGELHEWVEVMTMYGPTRVCKKTGYMPEHKGYLSKKALKSSLLAIERDERYKEYRNKKVSGLAEKHNMSVESMELLVEEIFDIKKQFNLNELSDVVEEMRNHDKSQ